MSTKKHGLLSKKRYGIEVTSSGLSVAVRFLTQAEEPVEIGYLRFPTFVAHQLGQALVLAGISKQQVQPISITVDESER